MPKSNGMVEQGSDIRPVRTHRVSRPVPLSGEVTAKLVHRLLHRVGKHKRPRGIAVTGCHVVTVRGSFSWVKHRHAGCWPRLVESSAQVAILTPPVR